MIGTTINGKYRIKSVLGHGGMGAVYLAEQLDVKGRPFREVALKVLLPAHSDSPAIGERLLREVKITALLESPRIVTVYDAGKTEDGQLYFTMRLIQGDTLKKVLDQGPLSVKRAVDIASQVCAALSEMHDRANPVIHRDLKPDNIFVEQQQGQDWVRVGDFGIAKILGQEELTDLTQAGLLGTSAYMAPEQWNGEEVDARTDLYAFGVILYELLTGQRPFRGGNGRPPLRQQHLQSLPPPLPTTIPEKVQALVKRLLAKNPSDRPATAVAVKRVLERVLEPPPPLIAPPHPVPDKSPPRPEPEKNPQRSPGRSKLWIAAVMVSVLLGVWLVLLRPKVPETKETSRSQPPVAVTPPPIVEKSVTTGDTNVGKDDKEMVRVPAGEFFMGCNEKVDTECDSDEKKPGQLVNLPAFMIDKTEVTVAEYRACVKAGRCSDEKLSAYSSCNWDKGDRENHPINCVDWNQADAFCKWAGKRLPSEAEWEKAARGKERLKYPWGNEWDVKKANAFGKEDGYEQTAPVGSFLTSASPYGALDMAGNVWEWTADWYDDRTDARSLRGGSWSNQPQFARASFRSGSGLATATAMSVFVVPSSWTFLNAAFWFSVGPGRSPVEFFGYERITNFPQEF